MKDARELRAEAALLTLERTRAQLSALCEAPSHGEAAAEAGRFPRSATFRWLLSHPVARWVGSVALSLLLGRLPAGPMIAKRLFGYGR